MDDDNYIDQLLKQALSPVVEPDEVINKKIMNCLKEKNTMKIKFKKRYVVPVIAIVCMIMMTFTAFAAWKLLNSKEVAKNLNDEGLASAFDSKEAIEINQTIVSGGFSITLHGIVSGEGLSDFRSSAEDIYPERTYAVVSITKEDGSPMPSSQDEEYGKVPFFVSPLIKGQKPWMLNIASMNGGYSEFVKNGIMYRLIECDGVEIFSDRGLYLCVSNTDFYDNTAFDYNEETGEVSPNTSFTGVNALFDLPLDVSKADNAAAEKYLQEIMQ